MLDLPDRVGFWRCVCVWGGVGCWLLWLGGGAVFSPVVVVVPGREGEGEGMGMRTEGGEEGAESEEGWAHLWVWFCVWYLRMSVWFGGYGEGEMGGGAV